MVATDTAVGIVGAVLLVAVMAGVFVYEYNNPATEASTEDEDATHFEEDWPGLSAREDLDGDGEANYEDPDIDGDGSPNADDDMLAVTFPVSGSIGQSTPLSPSDPFTTGFSVGNGTEHLGGAITYTRQGALGVGSPTFAARITDSSGQTIATATSTTSGNTVTLAFDYDEPLVAGDYTVEVTQTQPGTGGSFNGSIEVHYMTPAGGGHGH